MTPSTGWISVPNSFVSLFIFYILSYLFLKTMGCLSGCLVSSDSVQKLFCWICSAFKCSFDEFVGEKVVSQSYSSAILAPPPENSVPLFTMRQPWSEVKSLSHVRLFETPWTCSPPGSSIHEIFKARIWKCVAISSSNEAALLVHKSRVMDNSWIPSHSRLQTAAFYNGLIFIPTQSRWIGHITNLN